MASLWPCKATSTIRYAHARMRICTMNAQAVCLLRFTTGVWASQHNLCLPCLVEDAEGWRKATEVPAGAEAASSYWKLKSLELISEGGSVASMSFPARKVTRY